MAAMPGGHNHTRAHTRARSIARTSALVAVATTVLLAVACSSSGSNTEAGGTKSNGTTGKADGSSSTVVETGGNGKPTMVAIKGTGRKTPVDPAAAAANPEREDRTPASAWQSNADGVEHLSFKFGPVAIKSGQNNIAYSGTDIPKPDRDGYIVAIKPDLKFEDGRTPGVDDVHLHHAVWVNLAAKDPTDPSLPERFFAAGEEKSIFRAPVGYGYPYKTSDLWLLNYMIHNLWPDEKQVWVTYDIDFIPADSPLASTITAAHPLWTDVENGKIYPVFDAMKGAGKDGIVEYPDDVPDAYTPKATTTTTAAPTTTSTTAADQSTDTTRRRRGGVGPIAEKPSLGNTWTVDRDLTLIGAGAHLHPGGIYSDMFVTRAGAKPTGAAAEVATDDTVRLFRSEAVYYEPAGAVSWDLSMTATPPDWRVSLKKGDVLAINVAYDVREASWYESMGIQVAWYIDGNSGPDPFAERVDVIGQVSHGHLPENDNHGGDDKATGRDAKLPDPTRLTNFAPITQVDIKDYVYLPGDMLNSETVPEVKAGETLRFFNFDSPLQNGIWHTITACESPCNKSTGIAYPLADGDVQFDSGQLGTAGVPTANRDDWTLPTDIKAGFYTYFCRVHPFMRGSFKVTG